MQRFRSLVRRIVHIGLGVGFALAVGVAVAAARHAPRPCAAPGDPGCRALPAPSCPAPAEAHALEQRIDRVLPVSAPVRVVALRRFGAATLVDVVLPRRANNQSSWVLVDGAGRVVDVESLGIVARWEGSATLRALRRAHPDVAPFDVPLPVDAGARRLEVAWRLSTCHACATVGVAYLTLEFDGAGHWVAAHPGRVVADPAQSLWARIVARSVADPAATCPAPPAQRGSAATNASNAAAGNGREK